MIRIHTGEIERGQYPKEASRQRGFRFILGFVLSILNDSYSEDEKDPEALRSLQVQPSGSPERRRLSIRRARIIF